MKSLNQFLLLFILIVFLFGCNPDDEPSIDEKDKPIDKVQVLLPEGSDLDLSNTSILSLGQVTDLKGNQSVEIPFNQGTIELAFLMDPNNNIFLVGFLSDNRKEISVRTTTEVMLYYRLGYYLLPESGKEAFLSSVGQTAGFEALIDKVTKLFIEDPLMYTKGKYLEAINTYLPRDKDKNDRSVNRIYIKDSEAKSGISLSSIDDKNVILQNAIPRRVKVFVYKKSYHTRDNQIKDIPNYTETVFASFDFDPGKTIEIKEFEVGSTVAQINAQSAAIENISTIGPVELPVNASIELTAEYEVVVIGPGDKPLLKRKMTPAEKQSYEMLTKKVFILDYFLPTLLDIGGNKGLLPPYGSDKEGALYNSVLPVLEKYPEVLEAVLSNDFKTAMELFLPILYEDIRLSNDLRAILKDVYNIISDKGNSPNTFVQSQELIETGYPRTKFLMSVIYKNMHLNGIKNQNYLRNESRPLVNWLVKSIDAEVDINPDNLEVCLGEAAEIRVKLVTEINATESVEYHWSTSNKFGGRVQDIEGDVNNFGFSIITKTNVVSYISAALESDLSNGDNYEKVKVVIYTKNQKGELTEVGRDSTMVNNKRQCTSFKVSLKKRYTEIREHEYLGEITYNLRPPGNEAEFEEIEGALGYEVFIIKADGSKTGPNTLNDPQIGDGKVNYSIGVFPGWWIFETTNLKEAEEEAARLDKVLDERGYVEIEVKPKL